MPAAPKRLRDFSHVESGPRAPGNFYGVVLIFSEGDKNIGLIDSAQDIDDIGITLTVIAYALFEGKRDGDPGQPVNQVGLR